MILWINEVPLGTDLVQRIMSFSQKYHEQFLIYTIKEMDFSSIIIIIGVKKC